MCFLLSTNIYILRKKTSFLRKKGVGAWLGGLPQIKAGPSPQPCQTFPTEFSSGATRSHFFRGRSTTLLGKVYFSPRGPSPNRPATFPKHPPDLPHGIQLCRHSVAISPGKVHHPFGEGLLFPPGTFPITLASHGPLCHFRRGRSRHFFETFPKSPCHLPQGIQSWLLSVATSPGKVRHPFGEGLLFPQGTFPITLASQGPLCHLWWGRSRHFFETFPKSPCHLPQTPRDLPHGIQLWLPSVPLLPGKVHHPIPVQIAIITQDAAALSSKVAKNAVLF